MFTEEDILNRIKEFEAMTPEELKAHNDRIHAQIEADKERDNKNRLEEMIKACGLGEKFTKRTFETFIVTEDNKRAYDYFKNYAENFDTQEKGIYLSGSWGTGKTHLAAAVANHLLMQGKSVLFLSAVIFKNMIYGSYRNGTTQDLMYDITQRRLLILDDFDKLKTKSGEWDNIKELLYDVLNRLYEAERKVIFTANCNRAELENIYDGSIASRIAEMCNCFTLSGKDWRLR